jgi:hypothetical protein
MSSSEKEEEEAKRIWFAKRNFTSFLQRMLSTKRNLGLRKFPSLSSHLLSLVLLWFLLQLSEESGLSPTREFGESFL